MGRYVARRLLEAVLTLVALSMATFLLLKAMPFNLAAIMAGPRATPGAVASLANAMGLDLPLPDQYVLWLRQLLGGGGFAAAWRYAPPTLELVVLGSGLAAVCAFTIAYIQARSPNSRLDRAISLATFVLYTLPAFWLGFVLIFVFALDLLWLPAFGPNLDPSSQGFSQWIPEMVLPVTTLAVTTIATWTIYYRSTIEEALQSDYVRTARAKGLPERRVILKHVVRNVVLPGITLTSMSLPSLFNNVIVIEWVFTMPGLGDNLVSALTNFDWSTSIATVMVIGTITVLGSMVADLLYAVADPRIRFV
jgi:peptide/nickel transport system permease protein